MKRFCGVFNMKRRALSSKNPVAFNFRCPEVLANQSAAYDKIRKTCPVARTCDGDYMIFGHTEAARALEDTEFFSNEAGEFISIPHGLDDPEHGIVRNALMSVFNRELMESFYPTYKNIAEALFSSLARTAGTIGRDIDIVQEFTKKYSARTQCAMLGWPLSMDKRLIEWTAKNSASSLANDLALNKEIAREWTEDIVGEQLNLRRELLATGQAVKEDISLTLVKARINGKGLSNEEIASAYRNLDMGIVSSLCAGIDNVIDFLIRNPEMQSRLREDPSLVMDAIDEITRIEGVMVQSKRRAKQDVHLGGVDVKKGDILSINYISANRDEKAFESPLEFRFGRDHQGVNLMWGRGKHYCLGAPTLARDMMHIAISTILGGTKHIAYSNTKGERLVFPANGWISLPVQIEFNEMTCKM